MDYTCYASIVKLSQIHGGSKVNGRGYYYQKNGGVNGQLQMAKLDELIIGVKDTSKVRNWKEAKSHFVLLVLDKICVSI